MRVIINLFTIFNFILFGVNENFASEENKAFSTKELLTIFGSDSPKFNLLSNQTVQKKKLSSQTIDIQSFFNSCKVKNDSLLIQTSIENSIEQYGVCRPTTNDDTINTLMADYRDIQEHYMFSKLSMGDQRAKEMATLSKQSEFYALLQAGVSRIKTLKVLKDIDLNSDDIKMELNLLCSGRTGNDLCSPLVKKVLHEELIEHNKALNDSISLGLEKRYDKKTAKLEIKRRLKKINEYWNKVYETSKTKGANSIEAQLAYSDYIEHYSLSVSDPIGVMIINHPFNQIPKSLEDFDPEKLEDHSFRPNDKQKFNIQDEDIEKGFEIAISQSIRHVNNIAKCDSENETNQPKLHCLLNFAPTAVGQALAHNPNLATPGLCLAISEVNRDHQKQQKHLGYVGKITNFLDVISVPLLLAGGTGLLVKGISSILNRAAVSTASRGLASTSRRLSLSSLSNGMLTTSGTIGITSSGGRVAGGGYSAILHGSDYLTHTAALQAASKDPSSKELEKAINLRNQTLQSLEELKNGSFDFLPFGAFMNLARTKKIGEIAGKMKNGVGQFSKFERIAAGTMKFNNTLKMLNNTPGAKRAFQLAMNSKELGQEVVTNVLASISKMSTSMKNKIFNHLEKIKNNDTAIIKFFKNINRKSQC